MTNKPTEESTSFGAVICKYRKKNDLSQPELSKIMGVSRNTITNWENNRARPDVDIIRDLCCTLGIPLYKLFGIQTDQGTTSHERVILYQYRSLSPLGRRIVDRMVGSIMEEEQRVQDLGLSPSDNQCNETDIPPSEK